MKSHINLQQIPDVIRRRKRYVIVPFVIIFVISTVGAYLLPKRYESYTTILLQKDEILNPLVQFQMAVTMTQEDRLTSFNEIIYSRSTIEILLNRLRRVPETTESSAVDELIETTQRKISTSQRGSDSFRITVADSDPKVAQMSASILAEIYMETSLKSNQQQTEDAVAFFQQKVEEYRQKFEEYQRELLELQQGTLSTLPQGENTLRPLLDQVEAELTQTKKTLDTQARTKQLLESYAENIDMPGTVSQISSLPADGAILYIDELKTLSLKYTELLARYTPQYPAVKSARQHVIILLQNSAEALDGEIKSTETRMKRQEARRGEILENLSKSIDLNEVTSERRTNYLMYQQLYDNMRVKLEQARVSRDLGARGASKYVILDPAQVPSKPTKPKKALIIGGGFSLGLIIGVATMLMAEFYDPTIRRRQDIEVFQKPIIGYLP
jgi:polysaccharide biosynthesis transport protein